MCDVLDIRDFTRFSEERRPEEVIDYLNVLYSRFIEIVGRHNGIINKFLGDGFMAVFGAPVSDGRDVSNAVHAALEILDCVEEMNRKGEIAPTRIGMGLHAGSAVTGNVGSDERKEYTIIGDTVNLASRIEQLNKEYGSSLLVTDAVYSVMKDLPESPCRRSKCGAENRPCI
jgi:adenylate cyclase